MNVHAETATPTPVDDKHHAVEKIELNRRARRSNDICFRCRPMTPARVQEWVCQTLNAGVQCDDADPTRASLCHPVPR